MKKKIIITLGVVISSIIMIAIVLGTINKPITKSEHNQLNAIKLYDSDNGVSNFDSNNKDYFIQDSDDLQAFFSIDGDTSGMTFTVTEEAIDMADKEVPKMASFSGTLDGNNVLISNLTFAARDDDSYAFIEVLTSKAVIKNLNIDTINTLGKHNEYNETDNGYVHFIHTLNEGAMLYYCTFTNIHLGCGIENSKMVSYGYDNASLVGENNGLISHCDILNEEVNPYDENDVGNYFYALKHASAFASTATAGSYFERCSVYGAYIGGLECIGGIAADINGSYLTSNYVRGCWCFTLEENQLKDGLYSLLENKCYIETFINYVGGIVGKAVNSTIVNNIFHNQSSGNLATDTRRRNVASICGCTRIGGMIASSYRCTIDYNLFHGTLELVYTSGICRAYSTSDVMTGALDNTSVKHFNFITKVCDESEEKYFINVGNQQGFVRTFEHEKIKSLQPTNFGSFSAFAFSNSNGPSTKVYATLGAPNEVTMLETIDPHEYKIYDIHYETGVTFYFDDTSNQSFTLDASNLINESYYSDFQSQGDNIFKIVELKNYGYSEVSVYKRVIQKDNTFILEYSASDDIMNNSYVTYYDAAVMSYDYYSETYDPYEVIEGGYYLICDSSAVSQLTYVCGDTYVFRNVNIECKSFDSENNDLNDNQSHIFYNDQRVRICSRMWASGNQLINYSQNYTLTYRKETGYSSLTYQYTKYDSTRDDFDLSTMNSFEEYSDDLLESLEHNGLRIQYIFNQSTITISGNVQFDRTKTATDLEFSFIDKNNVEISSDNLSYSFEGTVFTLNLSPDSTLDLSNIFLRLSYKLSDEPDTVNIATLKSIFDLCGDDYSLITLGIVVLQLNYELDTSLADATLSYESEKVVYCYKMLGSADPTEFLYSKVTIEDGKLEEEVSPYGYPFNPLNNYNLASDKTLMFYYQTLSIRSYLFDRDNNTFYLNIYSVLHNYLYDLNFNPTIGIVLTNRYYKIYEYWNDDLVLKEDSKTYTSISDNYLDYVFYEEQAGTYEHNYCYTESDRNGIPKLYDEKNLYLCQNPTNSHKFMIIDIKYYTSYDPNNSASCVEYTGDLEDLSQDIYCVYTLAIAKTEDTVYKYTYYDLKFSVEFGTEFESNRIDFAFSSSGETYTPIADGIVANQEELSQYFKSLNAYIPNEKNVYLWILVYDDSSKTGTPSYFFAQTLSYLHMQGLESLVFATLQMQTETDDTYMFTMDYACGVFTSGEVSKDSAYVQYILTNSEYMITFTSTTGYEIQSIDSDIQAVNSVFEFAAVGDVDLNITSQLAYYHIYYYWTDGVRLGVALSDEDGTQYVYNLSDSTLQEYWSSYDSETFRTFYLQYTIEDSLSYLLNEGRLIDAKQGEYSFTAFLINKKVYKSYNPETGQGVLYGKTPSALDCQDIYIVFDIAVNENEHYASTGYFYQQYSVPNTLTYGATTYNYSDDASITGYSLKVSSDQYEYKPMEVFHSVKTVDNTVTYTFTSTTQAFLYAVINDETLTEENPAVAILEDINDFTIYKWWFSYTSTSLREPVHATLTLLNNEQASWSIPMDANSYFISGYGIYVYLDDYDGTGKSGYVYEIYDLINTRNTTYTNTITQDMSIGADIKYDTYHIFYSWTTDGSIILDEDITPSEINSDWIDSNYTWSGEHGLSYTYENQALELSYVLGVNQLIDFKRTGETNSEKALIAKINYYRNSEHTEEFGYKPQNPIIGDIYCVIDLAFSSDSDYTYQTKEVSEIKLNGEILSNFKLKSSDLEYGFNEHSGCSAAYYNGELYYYFEEDGYIWLFIDDEPACTLDNDSDSISCDKYSITVRGGDDDGEEINYEFNAGEFWNEGTTGNTKVYYVNKGENFTIRFTQFFGEEGYEYHVKDDSFTLIKNECTLTNIDRAYDLVCDFDYVKSYYNVYFYVDRDDISNDPGYSTLYGEEPELNARESLSVQFEGAFPAYPNITKEGYRLTKYYIYVENGNDIEVTADTIMPSYPVCVYASWVEAGRASFMICYYDTNYQSVLYDESEMSAANVQLYYEDNITNERTLMTALNPNVSTIDSMQYKISVYSSFVEENFSIYQFYFYPEDMSNGKLLVYLKYPDEEEYKYFGSLDTINNVYYLQKMEITTSNLDTEDLDNHISVLGNGWYSQLDSVTFTLDIEDGYYAYFTNSDLARVLNIYNSQTIRVASISDLYSAIGSAKIDLTIAKRQYHVYYYLDGNLVHTDDYYSGDSVTIWEPNDDILQGYRKSEWNETLDIMPTSNVTLYASIIYGTTNEYQINFSDVVTEGMFFIADNKEEITSKTIITEAVVLGDNRIEVTYKENQGFLWMIDPVTKTARYLDIDLDTVSEINLIKYTAPSEIEHLSITNLGYHLVNVIVGFEVTLEPGYTYETNESRFGNILLVSGKESDYEIDLREEKEKYSVYYFIKDTLVHEDEYYYGDDIEIWEYDPTLYQGEFNFLSWSSIPFTVMPASDVLIYGQEGASYSLTTMPNVSTVHANESLSKAEFSGGLVKIGSEIVSGKFSFKNPSYVVTKADSAKTLFDVLFQPDDISLAPYEFQMTILVCNPKYDGALDDIYVISKTSNSISVHINEKYEFYVENGSYQEGRELVLSNLKEETTYIITYRYKADDEYCASDAYELKVRTLSYDEMLYINSQAFGLSLLDSAISYFDNPTVQKYLSYFQARLSMDYELSDMSGIEAQTYVEFLSEVIGMLAEIEDARIPVGHLDANRIMDYANRKIDELANLAFQDNVSAKNLNRYKNYVINVLNVSDSIISQYNISMGDLIGNKTSNKLTALTNKNSLDVLSQTSFVINKVDELLEYDYSNYSHVDLNEYKDEYIGNTVVLMKDVNKQVHHTDSQMVTQNISKCVTLLQSQTYEDYTFNREEYDAIFFKAAEAAVVAHMQVIVLNDLDRIYIIKIENLDFTKRMSLKNVYLDLVDQYSDFDTFYLEYRKMIEAGTDMTYEDCISTFSSNLEAKLVIPVSSNLTSTEVIVVFVFASAVFALVCVIVARHIIIKRRAHYATGSRE